MRKFAQSIQVITAHRYRPGRMMQLTGTKPRYKKAAGMDSYDMLYFESNLADNGFGISQSLPLAVALDSINGKMILIDSPEAFL